MNIKVIATMFLCFLSLGWATNIDAQAGDFISDFLEVAQDKQDKLDELWQRLELTDNQQQQVDSIIRRGRLERFRIYRDHGFSRGQLTQSEPQQRRNLRELRKLRNDFRKAQQETTPVLEQQISDVQELLTEEQLSREPELGNLLSELLTFSGAKQYRRKAIEDYVAGLTEELGPPIVFPVSTYDGGRRGSLGLLIILLGLLTAEMLWSHFGKKKVYHAKETFANIGIAVGTQLLRPVSTVWKFGVFGLFAIYAPFGSFPRSWWMFLITFVVADFAYYWFHRLSHEVTFLWTMHHTHHSSPYMNLTTAIRLNWLANFASPFFFVPLVLIGFPGDFVALSLALGLFYQLFLHTEAVPRLGWFEGKLLNTPSAHRVHHGSNTQYIDKNYAGALIIWDRIFQTYAPEVEKVEYGVTTGLMGYNPFVIQLKPLVDYLRRRLRRERAIDNERQLTA